MRRLGIALAFFLLLSPVAIAHEGEHGGGELMTLAAVVPSSAADKAGLRAGDKILAWEGQELSTQDAFSSYLDSKKPGDTVSLTVERDGETFELPLTFGKNAEGGVSIGISIGMGAASPELLGEKEKLTGDECKVWIGQTYRLASISETFGIDLSTEIEENKACVANDLDRMPEEIPRGWCDNVFKIHCSGVDLVAEIGDAVVARCEAHLSESLGIDVRRNPIWNTCGEQRVFDRYSLQGEVIDAETCRSIFVDECGAKVES